LAVVGVVLDNLAAVVEAAGLVIKNPIPFHQDKAYPLPLEMEDLVIIIQMVMMVVQVLSVAVLTAHLESTSMNQDKVNVVIADQVLMEVVRIVHLENMNIST
jgi:hypothetical protein